MQITNTEDRYGLISILLHWIIAILIIGLVCLGLYMADLPVSLLKLKLYGYHKEFGLLVLMLVMLRIAWRLGNISPSLGDIPAWERFAARAVQLLFYIFMIALPITGWLLTSAAGLAPSFFGLFTFPVLIAPNKELLTVFTALHHWLAYALIATFFLHVGAALKHHFIDKDDILRRMLS